LPLLSPDVSVYAAVSYNLVGMTNAIDCAFLTIHKWQKPLMVS